MEKSAKWILDTDWGLDDAQAVLIALHYLDLVAITWVNGNTTVVNVVNNVAILVGVKGKDVPIYKGMSCPIVRKSVSASHYHATDGFGGKQEEWMHKAKLENIGKEHAVTAIIRIVNEEYDKGNEVGIWAIGPLSNIALAIKMDPDIIKKIKYVYIMGGTIHGFGNLTLSGEFNFASDPEASQIVISSFPMIHLLPWEAAFNFHTTPEDEARLLQIDNEWGKLFTSINKFIEETTEGRFYWCDGLCVAAIVDPNIVTKSRLVYGEVITDSATAAGSIFYNMHPDMNFLKSDPNITQFIEIDHDIMINMLEESIRPEANEIKDE